MSKRTTYNVSLDFEVELNEEEDKEADFCIKEGEVVCERECDGNCKDVLINRVMSYFTASERKNVRYIRCEVDREVK